MTESPGYVILGRGRWAHKMTSILTGESRRVSSIQQTRRAPGESDSTYRARLSGQLAAAGAKIAWLCVPPGPHVAPMLQACLDAGVHAVAEKPWFGGAAETRALQSLADANGVRIGIHYEYCLLEEVERWRKNLDGGAGLSFGGRFQHSRPDRLGISALDNLGSHLLSIREFAAPESRIGKIECAYEKADERKVWLDGEGRRRESLDLLANPQPIIQRFIAKFEAALGGAAWELDLSFALRVAAEVAALKK
jgi:predicted dehydrogenase